MRLLPFDHRKSLEDEPVNLPADSVRIIKSARSGKYGVNYVDFSFFKDLRH